MLAFNSVGLSNIFLAVIALVSIVILLILYRHFEKK